jgi:ssDNA-binding Zn-finger/Zn-ribbon topoisomerase 1
MNPEEGTKECPVCGENMEYKENNFDHWLECMDKSCGFVIAEQTDFPEELGW